MVQYLILFSTQGDRGQESKLLNTRSLLRSLKGEPGEPGISGPRGPPGRHTFHPDELLARMVVGFSGLLCT